MLRRNAMQNRFKKTAALSLAAAIMMSQAAYAENITLASYPGGQDGNYISNQGPSGNQYVGSNGYVQAGQYVDQSGYVNSGPGVVGNSGQTQPGNNVNSGNTAGNTQSPSQGQTQTGTGTQTNQVVIDQTIAKPAISSEAAVVYDATTKQILFDKNASQSMYPASTTKLMTALIVAENANLEDTVTYSATAVNGLESGASNVNLAVGDTLSVKDSLYALLLKSACEVANGLAEKVGGSQANFVALMNQKAQQLGCTNTHFENASGLNGTTHYTTAYDMALITKAALDNQTVRTINNTLSYTLPASKNRGELKMTNGNKMLNPSNSQYYAGIIGGKTGYTSKAGSTLATAVEKNGHELIVVVMKSNQKHYDDTKALLDYGYKLIDASNKAQGITGSSGTDSTTGNTANQGTGRWNQVSATQWQYVKADGSVCKSEWLDLGDKTYWFDDNTYMATGWRHFSNDAWYYFDTQTGAMVKNSWVIDNGKSYYLTDNGTMAKDTVVGGKYKVDASGVYVGQV